MGASFFSEMGPLPAPYAVAQELLVATQKSVGARRLVWRECERLSGEAKTELDEATREVRAARRTHAEWTRMQNAWAGQDSLFEGSPQSPEVRREWDMRAARLVRAQMEEDQKLETWQAARQATEDALRDFQLIQRSMDTDPLVQLAEESVRFFDFLKQTHPPGE